jgi:hypothetical protein
MVNERLSAQKSAICHQSAVYQKNRYKLANAFESSTGVSYLLTLGTAIVAGDVNGFSAASTGPKAPDARGKMQ